MTSFKCKVFNDSSNVLEKKNLACVLPEETYEKHEPNFLEKSFSKNVNKSTIFTDLIREEENCKSSRSNRFNKSNFKSQDSLTLPSNNNSIEELNHATKGKLHSLFC